MAYKKRLFYTYEMEYKTNDSLKARKLALADLKENLNSQFDLIQLCRREYIKGDKKIKQMCVDVANYVKEQIRDIQLEINDL